MSNDGGDRSIRHGCKMPETMADRAQQIALIRLSQEINERPVERTQGEVLRRRIAVVKIECACTSGVAAIDAATAEGDDKVELSANVAGLLGPIGARVAGTLVTSHPPA